MKTLVWDGPNAMHVEDGPEPGDPGPGELILKPEAVGICGSEVEGYLGHMGNRIPPLVMGHEFAGTVVATGEGARELDGARVAVNPLSGCGECRLCHVRLLEPVPGPRAGRRARPGRVRRPREGARRRRARAARRRLRPCRRADGAAGQRRPRRAAGAAGRRERGRARRGHDRAGHAPGRAAGRHPARRRDRAAGRAAGARGRARRPCRLRVAGGGQGRGRAGPRARRRRRAGDARARSRAAAARRDARLHRPRGRRHDARLPRRDPQPAPHPGLLRVHDAGLRAGPRVARERRRRRSGTTCRTCARSRRGRSSSRAWRAARRHPSSRSSSRHEQRCVVVIGASSGIGLATARAFRDAGDSVHAAARREISEPGIAGHTLDFTDHHAVANFAAPFERVDALIISAGTNIKQRRLHELTPDSWDHMVAANLSGPFYAIHSFLPRLQGGARDGRDRLLASPAPTPTAPVPRTRRPRAARSSSATAPASSRAATCASP